MGKKRTNDAVSGLLYFYALTKSYYLGRTTSDRWEGHRIMVGPNKAHNSVIKEQKNSAGNN